jgi:hypothetical protein
VRSSMSRAPWREHLHRARCAGGGVARAAASREQIVESLVAAGVLWPLVDHGPSCRSCAAPRRPPLGHDLVNCRSCVELTELYEGGLADLYPISYTAPDGALCAAVRELKDTFRARSDNRLAREIGAILSAYLQAQLEGGRLGLGRFDIVTAVPSPYWSDPGAENVWDGLARSVQLNLPITLAGARTDPDRDDLVAMLRLAARLRGAGARQVTALRYAPPKPHSLFHGKLVCGRVGYLGSANLTGSGLGEHVEAGLPLDEVDVAQVWWLLDVLRDGGLLVEQAFEGGG